MSSSLIARFFRIQGEHANVGGLFLPSAFQHCTSRLNSIGPKLLQCPKSLLPYVGFPIGQIKNHWRKRVCSFRSNCLESDCGLYLQLCIA